MNLGKLLSKKTKVLQTHISWVFLTGKYAYKVKKPVNFGFVDFSTLKKRKFYCERELSLNRRFSPEIYLKVLPITNKGKIIDFAVVMKEIPQERIMSNLLKRGKINKDILKKIAKIVADFHRQDFPKVKKKYKTIKIIKFNWDENFWQVERFIGKTISKKDFEFIKNKIYFFLRKNKSFFEKRIKEGKIKWCHGDLHSGNIFILKKIYIFDCIEFNERLACQDVANDVAFLAMDLDFYKKRALSDYFIKSYLKYSKDKGLLKLLNFYKCYRAFVRGKVNSLKMAMKGVKERERKKAKSEAKKYLKLALAYAKEL